MAHWLFKTEPSEFSIDDLQTSAQQTARWDGIRNYQARNFIRDQLQPGDTVWIYHSQCSKTGLAGLAKVVSPPYPDPSQWEPLSPYFDVKSTENSPRWFCIDIQYQRSFSAVLSLPAIKSEPALADMILLKQGRLSIQPISETQAAHLLRLVN